MTAQQQQQQPPANAAAVDPWAGTVAAPGGGGLPPGTYTGTFDSVEYLPESPPDPMTGKGGRQFPKFAFKWRLDDGREATRETPVSFGPKAAYAAACGWLVGRPLAPGDKFNLRGCVGRKYLLTVGPRMTAAGTPTAWNHVVNAMPLPPATQQ
jgi:hypothetical protein